MHYGRCHSRGCSSFVYTTSKSEKVGRLKLEPRSHIGREEFEKFGMFLILGNFLIFTDTQLAIGAVLQILFYQKLRVKRAVHFSLQVLRNGIHYQIMSKHQNPTCNSKRLSKATFYLDLIHFMQLSHQKVQ